MDKSTIRQDSLGLSAFYLTAQAKRCAVLFVLKIGQGHDLGKFASGIASAWRLGVVGASRVESIQDNHTLLLLRDELSHLEVETQIQFLI